MDLHNLYIEGITSWTFSEVSDTVTLIPMGYKLNFTADIPKISGSGTDIGELLVLGGYTLKIDGDVR